MKRPVLVLSSLFLSCLASAQGKTVLTLDESIKLALRQGYAVKNASSQYQSSKKSLESELRKLRTSVNLTFDLPNFRQSLTNQFDPTTQLYQYYQIQTTQVQGSVSVNQPILYTGGTFSYSQILLGRDQLNGLSGATTSGRDYFSNFFIQYRQPILTPNTYRQSDERSSISLEQIRAEFTRNQLDIVYNVTESFYSVYQLARRVEISKVQVKQNEESYATAKNKFTAGLIPEVDFLQTDVDLVSSQNELLNTERELARSMNAFRLLIGLPMMEDFELATTLAYKPVRINQETAISQALEKRSEIFSSKQTIALRRMDIESAEAKGDFRLDLTASYGLNGSNPDFGRVFQDFATTRSAALTVTVPLFDWGSNTLEVESAVLQHQNALLNLENTQQRIRQEVIDLISRLRVAESRIQVLEKSVAVAQKSYDISVERFRAGTINRNDVAQAQQRLTNAKVNSLGALIDYQVALADLKRRTLWDYENNAAVRPVLN